VPRRGRDRRRARAAEAEARPAVRTVRVRRSLSGPTGDRPMLIRAVVQARLFGLRLLTLDARVVVAASDTEPALDAVLDIDPMVMPVVHMHAPDSGRPGLRDLRSARPDGVSGSDRGVGHARELLAQGTDTLAALRRPLR
jgi:hypothetical protein